MRKTLSRLVFALGIAAAPLMMFGCAEEKPAEAPKPADAAPATPPPGGEAKPAEGGAAPAPAPAPAPAEAPK
jgi:hypothetical protein